MTTPRGKAPLTETGPNGREQARPAARGRRPKAAEAQAAEEQPRRAQAAEPRENLAEDAAQLAGGAEGVAAVLGSGLLGGSGLGQVAGALRSLGRAAVRQPRAVLRSGPKVGLQFLQIGLGKSEVAPEKGDKRFADPAWQQNPLFRTAMQTYLALGSELDVFVDNLGLEGVEAERMRFAASLAREAMAPTNFLWTNPAALKRFFDTGGGSIRQGVGHWAGDMLHNHGMPSMADVRPFKKGENIAASPGAVVHRAEAFELIQYTPQSETVYSRPLIVVPPQVNKYYAMDMSPGRSMYEFLLQHGIPVFGISWRNPTGAQRDWNFDTYVQAVIEAVDVAREISGSPDVNIIGACLGGITAALAQAHLAARDDDRIRSTTFMVTVLDTASEGRMFLFATPQTIALARKVSEPRGVIEGWQLASMFSWLRPNDLVWNYWVNNYLLGQDPPAFDILAWNADTTRLTSAFHHQMLDMVAGNQLVHPGALTVLGTPIDISRITSDTYVAAGFTDHITPWQSAYRTTQMVSGAAQFVMVSSGHIQTVVADPKHRGLGYFLNPETPPTAEQWRAGAERHEGSWWGHYAGWLAERSGDQVAPPQSLGSERYPPIEPAPGSYING
ncbi:MAG TPA: alpha/beta fold hydrolase [Streptosporangiaceae bacterium]|nr:alpha/beta fold hydrolase [Streptosporangiaceae bacterium]